MTGKTEEPCPVCDRMARELHDDHQEQILDLYEDLLAKLAALTEAHARGEHDAGQGT